MLSDYEQQRIEEWVSRLEAAVERADAVATKQANAAESMCQAANRMAGATDDFDIAVQNLEGTLARDRQRRKTGD